MSMFDRYKKDPNGEGLRKLVEFWELTPKDKRQKLIEIGMQDDPEFTQLATSFLLTFDDITSLDGLYLTEVLSDMPSRYLGFMISGLTPELQEKFKKCIPPKMMPEVRDAIEENPTPQDRGVGIYKLFEATRKMERMGRLNLKKIPRYNR